MALPPTHSTSKGREPGECNSAANISGDPSANSGPQDDSFGDSTFQIPQISHCL